MALPITASLTTSSNASGASGEDAPSVSLFGEKSSRACSPSSSSETNSIAWSRAPEAAATLDLRRTNKDFTVAIISGVFSITQSAMRVIRRKPTLNLKRRIRMMSGFPALPLADGEFSAAGKIFFSYRYGSAAPRLPKYTAVWQWFTESIEGRTIPSRVSPTKSPFGDRHCEADIAAGPLRGATTLSPTQAANTSRPANAIKMAEAIAFDLPPTPSSPFDLRATHELTSNRPTELSSMPPSARRKRQNGHSVRSGSNFGCTVLRRRLERCRRLVRYNLETTVVFERAQRAFRYPLAIRRRRFD